MRVTRLWEGMGFFFFSSTCRGWQWVSVCLSVCLSWLLEKAYLVNQEKNPNLSCSSVLRSLEISFEIYKLFCCCCQASSSVYWGHGAGGLGVGVRCMSLSCHWVWGTFRFLGQLGEGRAPTGFFREEWRGQKPQISWVIPMAQSDEGGGGWRVLHVCWGCSTEGIIEKHPQAHSGCPLSASRNRRSEGKVGEKENPETCTSKSARGICPGVIYGCAEKEH